MDIVQIRTELNKMIVGLETLESHAILTGYKNRHELNQLISEGTKLLSILALEKKVSIMVSISFLMYSIIATTEIKKYDYYLDQLIKDQQIDKIMEDKLRKVTLSIVN